MPENKMEKEKDCYESGEGKKSRMAGLCSGVGPCGHLLSISARTDTDPVYRRAPSAAAGRESVFLWPLIQIIVILFGRNRNMLPGALGSLLTDSQYEWAVCGITGFVLLIEALVILAVLYG